MNITSDHVTGFVVGLGAAALGLYMYKKNEAQIDQLAAQPVDQSPFSVPGQRPVGHVARRIAA